jgi:hypothetical protein
MINWIMKPTLQPGQSLQGNQLLIARTLSGVAVAGSLILFLIALPQRLFWLVDLAAEAQAVFSQSTELEHTTIERVTGVFPSAALTIEIGVMLLYCLIALLIYSRRSDEWLGLLTAAGLATFALHITPTLHTWMGNDPSRIFIGSLAKGIGLGLAFLFLYLFPGGYYSPSWIRLFFLGWIIWVVLWLANPDSFFSFRDPYTIRVEGFLLLMSWWGIGVFSQIYRYAFISGPVERQQTKYITFGIAIVASGYVLYVPLREAMARLPQPELAQIVFQMIAPYFFLTMVAAIPITIAFSILRYRLWDIDLIIRRTLIYSILSATLVVIYLAIVITLQMLVSDWMADLPNYVLAGSTLIVVVLINPLRRRIQEAIDRRFYRSKYDAEKALARFAAMARDEADMERLTLAMMKVVQDVLQPERVSVWLPADEDLKLFAPTRPIRPEPSFLRSHHEHQ